MNSPQLSASALGLALHPADSLNDQAIALELAAYAMPTLEMGAKYPFLAPHAYTSHFAQPPYYGSLPYTAPPDPLLEDTQKLQMQLYQELRNQVARHEMDPSQLHHEPIKVARSTASTVTDFANYSDPIVSSADAFYPSYTAQLTLHAGSKLSVVSDYFEPSEFEQSVASICDTALSLDANVISDVSRRVLASPYPLELIHLPPTPIFGDTPIFSELSVFTPNSSVTEDSFRLLGPPKHHHEAQPAAPRMLRTDLYQLAYSSLVTTPTAPDTPYPRKSKKRREPEPSGTPKKHTRKHVLARSRNGCWICRIKHLKCDEIRPVCRNCTRFGVQCDYSTARPDYVSNIELRRQKLDTITTLRRRRPGSRKTDDRLD